MNRAFKENSLEFKNSAREHYIKSTRVGDVGHVQREWVEWFTSLLEPGDKLLMFGTLTFAPYKTVSPTHMPNIYSRNGFTRLFDEDAEGNDKADPPIGRQRGYKALEGWKNIVLGHDVSWYRQPDETVRLDDMVQEVQKGDPVLAPLVEQLIVVTEYGKNRYTNRLHFHFGLRLSVNSKDGGVHEYIRRLKNAWRHGITRIEVARKAPEYMCKYLQKDNNDYPIHILKPLSDVPRAYIKKFGNTNFEIGLKIKKKKQLFGDKFQEGFDMEFDESTNGQIFNSWADIMSEK